MKLHGPAGLSLRQWQELLADAGDDVLPHARLVRRCRFCWKDYASAPSYSTLHPDGASVVQFGVCPDSQCQDAYNLVCIQRVLERG